MCKGDEADVSLYQRVESYALDRYNAFLFGYSYDPYSLLAPSTEGSIPRPYHSFERLGTAGQLQGDAVPSFTALYIS